MQCYSLDGCCNTLVCNSFDVSAEPLTVQRQCSDAHQAADLLRSPEFSHHLAALPVMTNPSDNLSPGTSYGLPSQLATCTGCTVLCDPEP